MMRHHRRMTQKLSHIGIAVHDLTQSIQEYRALGFSVGEIEAQPEHGVRVAFVALDNTRLELLEPLGEHSPIRTFLEKRGPGIHHIAIEVAGLQACLHDLKARSVPLIDETPRPGAHNHNVAFLHPKATASKVLIELCEPDEAQHS